MKRILNAIALICMLCSLMACNNKTQNDYVEELIGYYEMNHVVVVGTGGDGHSELESGYEGYGTLDIISFSDNDIISLRGSTIIEEERYSYTTTAKVNSEGIIEFEPIEWGGSKIARAFGWNAHLNIIPGKSTLKLTDKNLSGQLEFMAYDLDREQYYSGTAIVSGFKMD